MKFVTNGFAPMYSDGQIKIKDCPEGTVVTDSELITTTQYQGRQYRLVTHGDNSGWIYVGFLDEFQETLPRNVVVIDNATPDKSDAWQYANWFGQKQTNLCGQICAARVLGIDLKDVIAEWQQDEPKRFANVFNLFSSKKARGTGIEDLQNLFSVFDRIAVPISDLFKDANIPSRAKNAPYTPTRTRDIIASNYVVASCHIDNAGILRTSGTLHWVVLESVQIERWKMGGVQIFNPFMNSVEWYSWREWIASAGYPYGVAIAHR